VYPRARYEAVTASQQHGYDIDTSGFHPATYNDLAYLLALPLLYTSL
jgi:hypothetical protein